MEVVEAALGDVDRHLEGDPLQGLVDPVGGAHPHQRVVEALLQAVVAEARHLKRQVPT